MPAFKRSHRAISVLGALALTACGIGTAHAAPSAPSAAARAGASTSRAAASSVMTQDKAQAQARKTGKAVAVPGVETATSTMQANPDGSFTLTTDAAPVRKKVDGAWKNLDATLVKNPDGTVSPALSTDPLHISGGGTGALAAMRSGRDALALTLPVALPAPTLAGPTATYHDVLPGVDLTVTVDAQGGFSDVFVVHDAAAASNPKLASLLSANLTTSGVTVATDKTGDIQAVDTTGRTVFAAPAPEMWDSSTTSTPIATGTIAASHATRSNAAAPGTRARRSHLTAHISGRTLTLSPDQSVLRGASTTNPVYLDPTWAASGGSNTNSGWATVAENYPTDKHYDSSPESIAHGEMQVGQSVSGFWADTLINFGLPLSELSSEGTSVKINSAKFYITNTGSTNCTAQTVNLYAPSQTLVGGQNTNATWNNWFTSSRNLGSAIGSATFANGWSSSCPSASVGFPLSTGWITSDVAAGKSVQTLALAGTSYSNEQYTGIGSNQNDYEVFDQATPSLSITFEHGPAKPSNLYTTPNQNPIGNGSVTLNSRAYDPDGGTLTATYSAYLHGHTTDVIKSGSLSVGSGTNAPFFIPQSTMNAAVVNTAWGESSTNTTMSVDWTVTVTDTGGMSATNSANFTYSTAVPGAPDISTDAGDTSPCQGSGGYTVGTPFTLYLTHTGTVKPTSYTYQLNAGAGQTTTHVDSNGNASITITPTASTDLISVDATAASSNVGQATACEITAANAPNAAPGDLTGDAASDLLLTGTGSAALPSGLWLAPGISAGGVAGHAVNVGQYGTGVSATDTSPSSFTGTQAITGMFAGSGFNDILLYNPTTASTGACSGEVLNSDGQTIPLDPHWGDAVTSPVFTTTDSNSNTVCATSIGNGGGLAAGENQGVAAPNETWDPASVSMAYQPDLLTVVNGSLYLEQNTQSEGTWVGITAANDLSDTNPTGSGTWAGWTITTVNTAGDIPAMFAYNTSNNDVYYYSPATMAQLAWNYYTVAGGNTITTADTAAAAPVQLTGLTPSTYINLQATLVGTTPALDATLVGGPAVRPLIGFSSGTQTAQVTTFEVNGAALTSVGQAGTPLYTAAHNWPLNDQPVQGSALTSAADTAGTLALTGHGAVTGYTNDLFNPDAAFDGKTGYLTGNAGAITPSSDFSVSAWVKPTLLGGTVVSQAGSADPILQLASTTSGTWQFSLNTTAGGTAATYTTITGGTVRLGIWTELTATYNQATSLLTLYADGNEIAVGTDSAPPTSTTGPFLIGAVQTGTSTISSYYTGTIADVRTYTSVATPSVNPPGPSDFVPVTPTRILDTRSSSKIGNVTGPVAAGSTTILAIAGSTTGGLTIPTSGVTAVSISITETGASSNGFILAYPDGTPKPVTSTVNFSATNSYTNNAITPVGADGDIALYNNSSGTSQIIVDVTGYYTTDTTVANASTYMPLTTPTRILDTRNGTGATQAKLAANGTLVLTIAGSTTNGANIPADATGAEITAVAINLTAVDATGAGQLIAYPDGTTRPNTSNVNYSTTNPVASTVVVPVGTNGKIAVYNQSSTPIDVIGDVSGYYTTATTGQHYFPAGSDRVLDTRLYNPNTNNASAVAAYATINLPVPSQITADNPTLVLNLTVTAPTNNGNLNVYPGNQTTVPTASALNWNTGDTVANLSIAASATDNSVNIYNNSNGTIQLIIDTDGYFD